MCCKIIQEYQYKAIKIHYTWQNLWLDLLKWDLIKIIHNFYVIFVKSYNWVCIGILYDKTKPMFQTKPQNSQQYKLEHPMLTNDVNDLKKILQTDLESGGKTSQE